MELERTLAIFFSKCRKKHPKREFPLNSVEECAICELNNPKISCPSLLGLKEIFEGIGEEIKQMYFMGSKNPWKPWTPTRKQGSFLDPSKYFNNFNMGPHFMPYPPMWPQYQLPPW